MGFNRRQTMATTSRCNGRWKRVGKKQAKEQRNENKRHFLILHFELMSIKAHALQDTNRYMVGECGSSSQIGAKHFCNGWRNFESPQRKMKMKSEERRRGEKKSCETQSQQKLKQRQQYNVKCTEIAKEFREKDERRWRFRGWGKERKLKRMKRKKLHPTQ